MHLYSHTGQNASKHANDLTSHEEAGYTKLNGHGHGLAEDEHGNSGRAREAEAYELANRDRDRGEGESETVFGIDSGDEDASKIALGDEVDWMSSPDERARREGQDRGVRL